MPEPILIKGGTVATLGSRNRVLEGRAVLVKDGRIERIAPEAVLARRKARVVDARGKIVLPGFINAHMHFYSSMACGLGKAAPSRDFKDVLKNLWWRLDKKLTLDDCHTSALTASISAIRHGTTTIIDHHASPGAVIGSLGRIADAVSETGLRAALCYEVSDRDGEEVARDGVAENAEFARRCRRDKSGRLKALFGLHASFTLSDATLKLAAAAAAKTGSGFHIHAAEARTDQEDCLEKYGIRVVERLKEFGILGPKSIAAHCVHVNDAELDLLAKTKTAVVHNPQSNMNNAVGIADIVRMTDRGVLVGLGTDAMTLNMLEEVRVAQWAQHLGRRDPSAGFVETVSTLAFNNAKIARRYFGDGIGELKEGAPADIVLLDYRPNTPLDEGTFLGHLLFGMSQSVVDTTIVAGRVLMEKKKLAIGLDEGKIAAKSRELASKLWERF